VPSRWLWFLFYFLAFLLFPFPFLEAAAFCRSGQRIKQVFALHLWLFSFLFQILLRCRRNEDRSANGTLSQKLNVD